MQIFFFDKETRICIVGKVQKTAQVQLRQSDTNAQTHGRLLLDGLFPARNKSRKEKVFRESTHKVTSSTVCSVLPPWTPVAFGEAENDTMMTRASPVSKEGLGRAGKKHSRTRRIVLRRGRFPAATLQLLSAAVLKIPHQQQTNPD